MFFFLLKKNKQISCLFFKRALGVLGLAKNIEDIADHILAGSLNKSQKQPANQLVAHSLSPGALVAHGLVPGGTSRGASFQCFSSGVVGEDVSAEPGVFSFSNSAPPSTLDTLQLEETLHLIGPQRELRLLREPR